MQWLDDIALGHPEWVRLRLIVLAFGSLVFLGTLAYVATMPTAS